MISSLPKSSTKMKVTVWWHWPEFIGHWLPTMYTVRGTRISYPIPTTWVTMPAWTKAVRFIPTHTIQVIMIFTRRGRSSILVSTTPTYYWTISMQPTFRMQPWRTALRGKPNSCVPTTTFCLYRAGMKYPSARKPWPTSITAPLRQLRTQKPLTGLSRRWKTASTWWMTPNTICLHHTSKRQLFKAYWHASTYGVPDRPPMAARSFMKKRPSMPRLYMTRISTSYIREIFMRSGKTSLPTSMIRNTMKVCGKWNSSVPAWTASLPTHA